MLLTSVSTASVGQGGTVRPYADTLVLFPVGLLTFDLNRGRR